MLALQNTTDLVKLFGDTTRVRLLMLLAREELSVVELTAVTRLPQSRVSTHLGRLKEAGLVRDRPQGACCFYSFDRAMLASEAGRVWSVVRDTTPDPLLEQDGKRLKQLMRTRGRNWADSVAGQMERHYSPGRSWEATSRGLLGLARFGDVLDVASGDGVLAELIAPRARSVTCLDLSRHVMRAARERLERIGSVRFRIGDMHALPFSDAAFDQVLFMSALSYATCPERAIGEAARVLRPGGELAAVTLKKHRHRTIAENYDHRQMGFDPNRLRSLFTAAGFEVSFCEVTAKERRSPHFEVLTLHARRLRSGTQP